MSVPTSYTSAYPMAFREMDCRGLCRPTILPELMQDTATIHAEQMGMGRRVLLQKARAIFMLSRLYYFLNRPVRQGETVEVSTWQRGARGAIWYRDFSLTCQGVSLGRATSCWVLVSADTGRVIRPDRVLEPHQLAMRKQEGWPQLNKLALPALSPFCRHPVRYSDLDSNRHLNHVRSIEILTDTLGLEEEPGQYVSSLQINYLGQCRLGEELEVLGGQRDGVRYAAAAVDGARRLEMMAALSPVEGGQPVDLLAGQ